MIRFLHVLVINWLQINFGVFNVNSVIIVCSLAEKRLLSGFLILVSLRVSCLERLFFHSCCWTARVYFYG